MQQTTFDKLIRVQDLISDYRLGKIRLQHLVDSLDGTLRSMEEPLPKDFLSKWQDASFNLETIYALGKESVLENEIRIALDHVDTLISIFLAEQKNKPAA